MSDYDKYKNNPDYKAAVAQLIVLKHKFPEEYAEYEKSAAEAYNALEQRRGKVK